MYKFGNFLTYGSVFYSIFLIIIFFSRRRLKTIENKIYSLLIISNFCGLIIAIGCYFTVLYCDVVPLLNYVVSRLYLIYLVIFIFLFFYYLVIVISQESDDKLRIKSIILKILVVSFVILTFLIFKLPLYYNNVDGMVYSYGPAANVVYVLATLCMSVWTISLFINRKKVNKK